MGRYNNDTDNMYIYCNETLKVSGCCQPEFGTVTLDIVDMFVLLCRDQDRDVFNEKPSKEELAAATQVGPVLIQDNLQNSNCKLYIHILSPISQTELAMCEHQSYFQQNVMGYFFSRVKSKSLAALICPLLFRVQVPVFFSFKIHCVFVLSGDIVQPDC